MEGSSLSYLRHLCDEYLDPSKYICGGGYTLFHVDHLDNMRDKARTALNFYNKKKRKNFDLQKVVKANVFCATHYCLTFWARRDENDERHLFRGVLVRGNVLLCEIKDGDDEITIPAGHDEDKRRKFEIETDDETDDFHYEWIQNAPDVCSEDDSEDEKYYPTGRHGGVDVAGSAAGRLELASSTPFSIQFPVLVSPLE